MYIICFSLHSQCFKLYYKVCYMLLSLLEHFDLPFSIYCLALVTEYYLNFFNEITSILDNSFFFHLVNLLLSAILSLSWSNTVVILSSIAMTLLFLRNNQIPLHQSSNFVQLPSNHPRYETMLFDITSCAISLYTTSVGTANISFNNAGSVFLFLFETYSLVIFNNPNIFFNVSISVIP